MVKAKFPWIHFIHCVAHEASLIVKDMCKIDEVFIILMYVCKFIELINLHLFADRGIARVGD